MLHPSPSAPPTISPTTGTVLVLGGGVAGVQAALDKTFPSNDCSLCILAPKLVEAGRDANIDILTRAEIVSLSGEPGNFTATTRKHPRYIDETTCTGCGLCAVVCQIPRRGYRAPDARKRCSINAIRIARSIRNQP